MPTTMPTQTIITGADTVTWVLGVMASGFAFGAFLQALGFMVGGRGFTQWFTRE